MKSPCTGWKLHVVDVDVGDDMNGVGPVFVKSDALRCKLESVKERES